MIEPTENPFDRIQKIQSDIDSIKNMKENIRNRVRKDINDSLPSFAKIYDQKKASAAESVDNVIKRESNRRGLDKDLIRSVIQVESNFDPNAVSDKGARGLMQLMPETAEELGVNPDDPTENIKGGTEYLAKQLDEFGNLKQALAAYNAGPDAVKQFGGIPPFPETQDYVKQVTETFRNLKKKQ